MEEVAIGTFVKIKPIVGVLPYLQGKIGQVTFEIEEKYFEVMVEGRPIVLNKNYVEKYERRF